jgi:polar amino acid transport system substrate-binding protein
VDDCGRGFDCGDCDREPFKEMTNITGPAYASLALALSAFGPKFRRPLVMIKTLGLAVVMIFLALSIATAVAQQKPDPRVADLIQAGKIRVGLFPPQYIKDSKTGELKSVWVEVARALAERIGVELIMLERPTPPAAVECLKADECDVIFLPFDARAANAGNFSFPFIQFEYTLLVPAASPIRAIPDADRPGVHIAAVRNHASTITLSRILRQAELLYADTPDPTFELLRSGRADVMASTRNALLEFSNKLPGSRVLEDYYGANLNRVVVPKGRGEWLAYVNEFVEKIKASGLVQKAIDRVGPRGIMVAPPGNSN